jgi:hypothetical protein
MPDQSSSNSSSSTALWVIIPLIVLSPFILIGLALIFSGSSSETKPPQAIDPTNANSAQLITDLKSLTDPSKTIGETIGEVFKTNSLLADVIAAYNKVPTTPANKDKKDALEASMSQAGSYLTQIAADGEKIKSSTTDATAQQQALFAQQQLRSLEPVLQRQLLTIDSPYTGTAAEAVQLARQLIVKNNNGAKAGDAYVIPYVVGGSSDNLSGTDSSGFLMQIWDKLGITLPGLHVNGSQIGDLPGFITVRRTDGTDISNANLMDSAKLGDLRQGDVILSGSSDSAANCLSDPTVQCHVVMYLGGPQLESPDTVGEATRGNGKSGPQYTTLDNRAKYGSKILAVYRAPYAQP